MFHRVDGETNGTEIHEECRKGKSWEIQSAGDQQPHGPLQITHRGDLSYEYEALFKHDNKDEVR